MLPHLQGQAVSGTKRWERGEQGEQDLSDPKASWLCRPWAPSPGDSLTLTHGPHSLLTPWDSCPLGGPKAHVVHGDLEDCGICTPRPGVPRSCLRGKRHPTPVQTPQLQKPPSQASWRTAAHVLLSTGQSQHDSLKATQARAQGEEKGVGWHSIRDPQILQVGGGDLKDYLGPHP